MSLISVTREERNGRPSVSDDLISYYNISHPIREVGGKAFLRLLEKPIDQRGSENLVIGDYLVSEDLATVVAQSDHLFIATVSTRDGIAPKAGYDVLGFVTDRIMGPIMEEGSGSKFLYHELNASRPVVFIVDEAPAAILLQL